MTDMISAETVTRVWQDMAQVSADEAPRFVQQMEEEQPAVMAYLLAAGEALFNQHEQEIIFYLGMVVWQMMKQSKRRLRKVTERKLEQAEEANLDFLERLSASPEADFERATQEMLWPPIPSRRYSATSSKRLWKKRTMTLMTHPSVTSTGGWLLCT